MLHIILVVSLLPALICLNVVVEIVRNKLDEDEKSQVLMFGGVVAIPILILVLESLIG